VPLIIIRHKPWQRKIATRLAGFLPDIVAPALTLPERTALDGLVAPKDIIVWCSESSDSDVHADDLAIVIFAHDFPERKADLEDQKETILDKVRDVVQAIREEDPDEIEISGFVWLLLFPSAFGSF